jgi:hypothetical protein
MILLLHVFVLTENSPRFRNLFEPGKSMISTAGLVRNMTVPHTSSLALPQPVRLAIVSQCQGLDIAEGTAIIPRAEQAVIF